MEINLTFDVAIELIKTERKDQSRLRKISAPMTSNSIFNELLEAVFTHPEYAGYLAQAYQSLAPPNEISEKNLPPNNPR